MSGTYGDSTQLIYLRARYYNPAEGRFVSRDPSGLESNLHLYTRANPINRVDPSGLFSQEQIAQSFGMGHFTDVIGYYDTNGQHWGFLAALLRALPGDKLIASDVYVGFADNPHKRPTFFEIGYDKSQGITFNNIPLKSVYRFTSSENPTSGSFTSPPWRGTGAYYYTVLGGSFYGKESYVDGSLISDLPDFWGISGTYGNLQGVYMRDRFGHAYFTFPAFTTSLVGLSYVEGYVNEAYLNPKHGISLWSNLSEEKLYELLRGLGMCGSGSLSFVLGYSVTGCLNGSVMSIYSLGAQAGSSGEFSPVTIPLDSWYDASKGWDKFNQDRYNGVAREGLLNIHENVYDGCNANYPHLIY